ncbi:aldo/keto reductase [Zopfochytrium polystomum]|nr:aldo/keto reductase [Zopfochytrium polystomum]
MASATTTTISPKKMATRFLGSSGTKVSELCLGAMTFGDGGAWRIPTESDEQAVFEMLDAFRARGGNFIDTADVYGGGASERVVGKWLQKTGERDNIVVATKAVNAMGPDPNQMGASRRHLVKALEASLERLQTPYIDLYQMHMWDAATPPLETLSTLTDFVRAGKVLYIGCSNYTAAQVEQSAAVSERHNLASWTTIQQQYSLLERGYELDLAATCGRLGIGCLPWSPLKGGWLAGKFRRGAAGPAKGSRLEWAEKVGWSETSFSAFDNEVTWRTVDALDAVAAKHDGAPVSAVALRWLIQKSTVTAPVIGARTRAQLDENLKATEIVLSDEDVLALDKASALPRPYPYNVIENANKRMGRFRL